MLYQMTLSFASEGAKKAQNDPQHKYCLLTNNIY